MSTDINLKKPEQLSTNQVMGCVQNVLSATKESRPHKAQTNWMTLVSIFELARSDENNIDPILRKWIQMAELRLKLRLGFQYVIDQERKLFKLFSYKHRTNPGAICPIDFQQIVHARSYLPKSNIRHFLLTDCLGKNSAALRNILFSIDV